MDIHSVLAQMEAERKARSVTAQLYRYSGLMQTIGLFSQRLTNEQCLDIAFEAVNELLTTAHACLLVPGGAPAASANTPERLFLLKTKGAEGAPAELVVTEGMRHLARAGTGVLIHPEAIRTVLADMGSATFPVHALVPFLSDGILRGLLLLGEKATGTYDDDDAIILEALTHLTDNAMQNNQRYEALERVNRDMDAKVFDLFAINQATRALMSETTLESLAHLSVDVFSEVMRSRRTSFFLADETTGEAELLAYLDVMDRDALPVCSLRFAPHALSASMPAVFNLSEEADVLRLNQVFPEGDAVFAKLGARVLVLLASAGRPAGLITLGDRMEGGTYQAEQLEVLESLGAATLIAVENARLIEALGRQKRELTDRLDRLLSLSTLIKNINSSGNLETLFELTGRTLEASFGVSLGMLLRWDAGTGCFRVARTIGFEGAGELDAHGAWASVQSGTVVCESGAGCLRKWVPESILTDASGVKGLLIEPVQYIDIHRVVLGAIVVFAFRDGEIRSAEKLLTLEAISNHLALMMLALDSLGRQSRFRMPGHIEGFKRELRHRITEALSGGKAFDVLHVSDTRGYVFRENNLAGQLEAHYDHVYPVAHNDVFLLPDGNGEGVAEALTQLFSAGEVRVRVLRQGRDFMDYKDFFDLM